MKKQVLIRTIEFYESYEKPVQFSINVEENKEYEQIKDFFYSWEKVKRFCNNDFLNLLFVKAIIYENEGFGELVIEELK